MGSVFQKTVVRPLPATARITAGKGKDPRRIARWKSRGKMVEAEVLRRDGRDVVRVKSGTYYAKYRNADGIVGVVPTGCRDRKMAEQVLSRLEREVERVKSGVATRAETHTARAMAQPIGVHIDAYLATLAGSAMHRQNTGSYLRKLAVACEWSCLADMKRSDLETWLAAESRIEGGKPRRSARSRNAHQTAVVSFCNWLVKSPEVMPYNPFDHMPKAKLKTDPRRQRRALTLGEVARLVEAARTAPARPKSKRKSARPEVRLTGPDRAILYLVLVYTGLRVGELAKIRVRDVRLEGGDCKIDLPARVGKNRQEAIVPLRRDLAEVLRPRLEGKPPASTVFDVPSSLTARFDGDCKRAGIPKRDDRDLTADIHSLRKTFNTWLAKAGVAPRVAQELMRHEDIKLTMGAYTDAAHLDLAAAVEALPALHHSLHQMGVIEVPRESTDVNQGPGKDQLSEPS